MKHRPEFKAKVALAAIRVQDTVAEIARQFHLNANMVHKWKREALDNMAVGFGSSGVGSERQEDRDREAPLVGFGHFANEQD